MDSIVSGIGIAESAGEARRQRGAEGRAARYQAASSAIARTVRWTSDSLLSALGATRAYETG